jgi:O-antigen ligase
VPVTAAASGPRLGARVVALSGGGIFGGLLVAQFFSDHIALPGLLVLCAFAALAAARPPVALGGLALFLPIATWIGRNWNGSVAWPEALTVAFAAGYCARAVQRGWGPRRALDVPVLLFVATVAASLVVKAAMLYATIGGDSLIREFLPSSLWDYFVSSGGFRELDAAMRLIEGMVLLHAAATCALQPAIASRLIAFVVAGGAVASALNLWRIWIGAQRADAPFEAFVHYLFTLRFNTHYGDVNAAGSHFVMILIPALALCTISRRWLPAPLLIVTSVALSGSRSALLAGVIAVGILALRRLQLRAGRPTAALKRTAGIIVIAGLCVAAAVVYVAARRNLTPSSTALQYRLEFVKTTFRMLADYPFFGVGVGQYPARTDDYSSPLLLQTFGAWNENAHNNFLQVLGELGLVGAAAFLLVLATATRSWMRRPAGESDRIIESAAAGSLAFILTWFSGHPLLLDAPALSFWLLFGLTVGGSGSLTTPRPSVARFAIAALLLLAISIPIRARTQIASADLEHQGIGLSTWRLDDEGRRYRVAGPSSVIFVPSQARGLIVPLRAVSGEAVVSVLWNGRPADRIRVPVDRWLELHMAVPADGSAPRFSQLGLHVEGAPESESPLLMIGKIEPR